MSKLPTGVLSLRRFVLRRQVLTLYRDLLRTIRGCSDTNHRQQMRDWTRTDFKVNKHHSDEDTIKMLIANGKRSLTELKALMWRTK